MKKIGLLILMEIFCLKSIAQLNLVPNPGFELFSLCPDGSNQLSRCQNWSSYGNTPDYFHACSTVSGMAPPNSMFGYQATNTGNGYAGIVTYSVFNSNYREIIGAPLISSLIVGQKYFFSFFVNFSFDPASIGVASNKVGLRFSTIPYSEFIVSPINNFTHFYSDSIIADSVSWHFMSGHFIADSVYNYIAIGNFFQDSLTDTIHVGTTIPDFTYYYIDDVCVSTDSLFNQVWTGFSEHNRYQNQIFVYPNPTSDLLFLKSIVPINSISITNTLGQIVFLSEKQNNHQFEISIRNLISGIYFVKVKTQMEVISSSINIIH